MLNPEEKKKILKRLVKIMALTESSNSGEAAAALHQANSLMEKYGLDSFDVKTSSVDEVEMQSSGVKVSDAENQLVGIICTSLGVMSYFRQYKAPAGYKAPKAMIIFVGEAHKAQIAVYAFEILRKKLKQNMNKSFKDMLEKFIPQDISAAERLRCAKSFKIAAKQRKMYAKNWCYAIREKVSKLAPSVPEAVKDYIENMNLTARSDGATKKRVTTYDAIGSYLSVKGMMDGRSVELNQAVGKDQTMDLVKITS